MTRAAGAIHMHKLDPSSTGYVVSDQCRWIPGRYLTHECASFMAEYLNHHGSIPAPIRAPGCVQY